MRVLSPVFGKEMVTLARRKRHFLARAMLLGVLLAAISISWLSGAKGAYYRGFVDTSRMGRNLFLTFSITQLLAVAVLMPALTAPIVAAEKDRNTLGLLLMSNLRTHNILLDKLLSRMALVVLLLVSGLPLFLTLLAFGGITPGQILDAYASIFATILFCSGLGLLCSTLAARMHTAMIATYSLMAGYVFTLILLESACGWNFDLEYFLPGNFSSSSLGHIIFFFVLSALVFLVSLLVCLRLLPKMTGYKRPHVAKRVSQRMNRFFEKINFAGVVVMGHEKALGGNAVMWKETHKRFFCSRTFIVRASYTLLALSIIVVILLNEWNSAPVVITLAGTVLLAIIALLASSTAFTTEKEKHSLETLMSSPVTAGQIVMAKFVGVLKLTVPVLICMTVWMLIAGWFMNWRHYSYWSDADTAPWLGLLLIVLAHLPMMVVIGLWASASRRKTASAILQTFLVCLGLWVLPPLIVLLDDLLHVSIGDIIVWLSMFLGFIALAMVPVVIKRPRFLAATIVVCVGAAVILSIITYFAFGGNSSDEEFLVCFSPLGAMAMLTTDDVVALPCMILIPCWIVLLGMFMNRFDGIIGRQ